MRLGLGLFNSHVSGLPSFLIAASASPVGGGTVTGAAAYKKGQTATLTATPDALYDFVRWSENGVEVSTDLEYTFAVTTSRNLVAEYQIKTYNIQTGVDFDPSWGSATGGGTYPIGTPVTLTATPSEGYDFVQWKLFDTPVSTNPTLNITAEANVLYIAEFAIKIFTISVSDSPAGSGVTSGSGSYGYGSVATMTAEPAAGYGFVAWKEGEIAVSLDATYIFTVTDNRTLVAEFEMVPPAGTHWGYALDLNGTDEYVTAPHSYKDLQLAANNSFVDWTAGVPNSWTKQGTSNGTNYIEESPADSIHIVSDGATMGISQNILTIGERYLIEVDATVNSGSIKVQLGGSGSANVINSTGTKIIDSYCDGTDGNLFLVRNAACNVVVSEIRVYHYVACLDATSITNQITSHNNWNFEQATSFAWATGGNHAAARSSSNPKKGAYSLRATVTGAGDSTTNFISLPSSAITPLTSGNQYAFGFFCFPDTTGVTVNWSIGDKTGSMALTGNAQNYVHDTFTAGAGTVSQPVRIWFSKACSAYIDLVKILPKQDFAISFWFRLSGTPANNGTILSAMQYDAAPDRYGMKAGFYQDSTLCFELYHGEVTQITTAINDTAWHLVTATYAGTTLTMYVDGVQVATVPGVTIGGMGWIGSLFIGSNLWGTSLHAGLLGEIQYVRFDNLAASNFDATLYFAAGIPKSYTGGVPTIDLHMKWAGADDAAMFTNAGTYNGTFSGTNVSQANDQLQASSVYITRD